MHLEYWAIFRFGHFSVGIHAGSQPLAAIEAMAAHYGGSVEQVWTGGSQPSLVRMNEPKWPSLESECFELDMAHALLRQGAIIMHGAAISHLGRNILILGESHAGKSTLSFLGMNAGWKVVSDDSLLAWRALDGAVHLRPYRKDVLLRRAIGIDPISNSTVPLQPLSVRDEMRWVLRRETAEDAFLDSLVPNCIWVSTIDHQREQSEAMKASQAVAFAALVRGASPLYMTPDYPTERAILLPIITELTRNCPAYRVSLGENLLTHSEDEMQRLLEITS